MLPITRLARFLPEHSSVNKTTIQHVSTAATEWLRRMAALSPTAALTELNSTEHGLTEAQAQAARELWGTNAMPGTERPSFARRIAHAFADTFCAILAAIAAVSLASDWLLAAPGEADLATPAIVAIMIAVSSALRFVQEERSGNEAAELTKMVETTCHVKRADAGVLELAAGELAVGDVVRLAQGDVVPADLRLVHARNLFVSQSALTGESEAVEKLATPRG